MDYTLNWRSKEYPLLLFCRVGEVDDPSIRLSIIIRIFLDSKMSSTRGRNLDRRCWGLDYGFRWITGYHAFRVDASVNWAKRVWVFFFFLLPLRCVFDPPCRNSFLSGWCQDGMSPFLSQVYVVVGWVRIVIGRFVGHRVVFWEAGRK